MYFFIITGKEIKGSDVIFGNSEIFAAEDEHISLFHILNLYYRPFHKTLPRTSAFVYWISVWFYETDCTFITYVTKLTCFFLTSYLNFVNIGTMPRFITWKILDIWDNSVYLIYQKYDQFVLPVFRKF